MYYTDGKLQYTVRVDTPNPLFAKMLQQAIGGIEALPIPNSFPQGQENGDFSYAFMSTGVDGVEPPQGRWSEGPSLDGRGPFSVQPARPLGDEPVLSSPAEVSFAQNEQLQGGPGASPQSGNPDRPQQLGGGMVDKVKDTLGGS